ncbi:hypothetical protein [Arthrobacter bambusae]|uniref:Uncharacterized protein n=1 Tax=Arthrobacter bambusae TaxID=1338426 RepID=A0AAW8DBJ6_9MICC|nr:hypothetical protein [Arthrobacter bambusae]MDP9903252.1 hypothetical protein [Arthrobacter bambusae]MDQ0128754.1 hypothetical protein [Arthrobacter bambusae]MDQ0180095.1 hypothetical protein [Arthrobacter bambusae]
MNTKQTANQTLMLLTQLLLTLTMLALCVFAVLSMVAVGSWFLVPFPALIGLIAAVATVDCTGELLGHDLNVLAIFEHGSRTRRNA